jgi:hypothetical protein
MFGHEVLQAGGALLLRALADDLDRDRQLRAVRGTQRAQGGQHDGDAALVVGGAATEPPAVPLDQLPR